MTQRANLTDLIKRSFSEMMKDVATSIPGHILAFDSDTQLAQIQIGIQRIDIKGVSFTPPPLIEVPVYFSGGSFLVEHQIDPGDEGIILFSQRCIDGWLNTGGVADNPILRFHDFSDAMFLPGVRSQPNKIESFANNGVRLRNADGTQYVWLKNDGTVEIKSTGFNVQSPTFTHNGVDVGENHNHAAGTYTAGATPVTGNSGDPV